MRGSTRTLIGFILLFGSLAELFLTHNVHSFVDVMFLMAMTLIGAIFLYRGYIARHFNGIC